MSRFASVKYFMARRQSEFLLGDETATLLDSLLEETFLTISTICRSLFQLPKMLMRNLSKVKLRNMTASLLIYKCVCVGVFACSFTQGMFCMNFHQSKAAFEVLCSLSSCSFFYNVSQGESEHEVGQSQFDLRNLVVSKDLNGLRM